MEKAERHYLVQCNYCGGFAQGRFAFIMFIQMFMLILRRACCSLFSVYVCVRVDVFLCGWMVEVWRRVEKKNAI